MSSWNWAENDIAEVEVQGRVFNQTTLNVLHFQLAGPPALADGFDAAEDLYGQLTLAGEFAELMRACITSLWKMEEISVQRIYPVRQRRFDFVVNINGALGDQQKASNIALTIEKFTDAATEENPADPMGQVGAMHVPCPPPTKYTDGVFDDAFLTGAAKDLADKMAEQLNTPGGNVWNPVIYHRNATTRIADRIFGCTPQRTVRVSRRRTVGVGI